MGPREFYDELPSTQDRAIALAREGAPAGTRVVARRQTKGRGRLTRSWASPEGGLYCSVIVPRPPQHPGLLPLTTGAHLGSALRAAYALSLLLKWPNDLLVERDGLPPGKLAGILTDEVPSPTLGRAVVTGIGVNVRFDRATLPEPVRGTAVALGDFVAPVPPLEDVEAMVVASAAEAAEWLSTPEGTRRARELVRRMLYGVGRPVTVDGTPAGTIEGLGEEGELWLATDRERVAIWAGDVRVEADR